MDLRRFQNLTKRTDTGGQADQWEGHLIPLFGLVGEVGSLISEYKKMLRDNSYSVNNVGNISEEIGDILWYLANLSTKNGLNLQKIATQNLEKTRYRWGEVPLVNKSWYLDGGFQKSQQLPRKLTIRFKEERVSGARKIKLYRGNQAVGDEVTDNSYDSDGYRFHDVFHLSYAAILGWSPVTRAILKCKRRDSRTIDEVEDGGRAIVIEEGISAFLFSEAKSADYFNNTRKLDFSLLRQIKRWTSHLEVSRRTFGEWELAILRGYAIWRKLKENNGGSVSIDMAKRSITYRR